MKVSDLAKQFSGQGGCGKPDDTQSVASNSSSSTKTRKPTQVLSFHEEMLRQQRLAKEQERERMRMHRELTARVASTGGSLIETSASLAAKNRSAELNAKEEAAKHSSQHKGVVGSRWLEEIRQRDAAAKEAGRKAEQDTQLYNNKYRGSGSLSLLEQSAQLYKERKAKEKEAEEQTAKLQSAFKGIGGLSLAEQGVEIEKQRKLMEREASQKTSQLHQTGSKGVAGLSLQEQGVELERKRKIMEREAIQKTSQLQAGFKSSSLSLMDQGAELEKQRKAMEKRASEDVATYNSTAKGTQELSLHDQCAKQVQSQFGFTSAPVRRTSQIEEEISQDMSEVDETIAEQELSGGDAPQDDEIPADVADASSVKREASVSSIEVPPLESVAEPATVTTA